MSSRDSIFLAPRLAWGSFAELTQNECRNFRPVLTFPGVISNWLSLPVFYPTFILRIFSSDFFQLITACRLVCCRYISLSNLGVCNSDDLDFGNLHFSFLLITHYLVSLSLSLSLSFFLSLSVSLFLSHICPFSFTVLWFTSKSCLETTNYKNKCTMAVSKRHFDPFVTLPLTKVKLLNYRNVYWLPQLVGTRWEKEREYRNIRQSSIRQKKATYRGEKERAEFFPGSNMLVLWTVESNTSFRRHPSKLGFVCFHLFPSSSLVFNWCFYLITSCHQPPKGHESLPHFRLSSVGETSASPRFRACKQVFQTSSFP